MRPAFSRITVLIDSLIEPRCTGMCGALAIRLPVPSKMAQEKSRRSLMFTEYAVFCSRRPICSAIDMNRLLKISSLTGSTSVPIALAETRGCVRSSTRWSSAVTLARHSGSTTVVALAELHDQRGVGAVVLEVYTALHPHP